MKVGSGGGEKCDHSPDPLCHSGKLSLTSLGDEN